MWASQACMLGIRWQVAGVCVRVCTCMLGIRWQVANEQLAHAISGGMA